MEDLDQYNGDHEHDMWVDFEYHEKSERFAVALMINNHRNAGELSEYFFAGAKRQADYDDSDLDAYVDNLNDWK